MSSLVSRGRRPETLTRRRRRERMTRREMVKMGLFVVSNEVHAEGGSRAVGGVTVVRHDAIPGTEISYTPPTLSRNNTAASQLMVVGDGSTTTRTLL